MLKQGFLLKLAFDSYYRNRGFGPFTTTCFRSSIVPNFSLLAGHYSEMCLLMVYWKFNRKLFVAAADTATDDLESYCFARLLRS